MKKGHPPSLLSPETDGKLVGKPSNNIPKIILMIDDPVIYTPSSLFNLLRKFRRAINFCCAEDAQICAYKKTCCVGNPK